MALSVEEVNFIAALLSWATLAVLGDRYMLASTVKHGPQVAWSVTGLVAW